MVHRTSASRAEHKPRKLYDSDGEYLTVGEQPETKAYAREILAEIAKCTVKVRGKLEPDWISGAEIRRRVAGDVSRWEAAIALLVEQIETRQGGLLTYYRLHDMRPLVYKAKFEITQTKNSVRPFPSEMYGEEHAKII